MKNEIQSAIDATQGDLIIGNHDSIILLGAKSQADLRDCSRNVSKLLLESSIDLDVTISDVVYEIQKFQDTFGTEKNIIKHKAIMKKYSTIFKLLDDVTLYLKLQQAQLIKEVKMLECLKLAIEKSKIDLENCLSFAEERLSKKQMVQHQKKDGLKLDTGQALDNWYSQLERRVEDLKISQTISLQSQVQITLLIDNNRILIDKIASAISNTIPVWQNQVSLLLGVELLEKRIDIQTKVTEITESYIYKSVKHKRRSFFRKEKPIDIDKLLSLNRKIQLALTEIEQSQNEDEKIKNILQEYLIKER